MKKRIVYLHGLGSGSNSSTGNYLKERLKEDFIVDCPEIPQDPIEAFNYLRNLHYDLIVGSSLGGLYALLVGYPCKRIIMNPAIHADKYIKEKIGFGTYKYFCERSNGDSYVIDNDFINKLNYVKTFALQYANADDDNMNDIHCFVSANDSLLGKENKEVCEELMSNVNEIFCDHRIDNETIDKYIIPKIYELIKE